MARKTKQNDKPARAKTAIEDTFVAPKRKREPKPVTLAEALAEQAAEEGKTVEEVTEELTAVPAEAERPVRQTGMSNLAQTIRTHRRNYGPMLHPNGKKTQNNGDQVAVLLLSIGLPALQAFSATRFEGKTYDHLNPGHARMCIGNLIRACVKKGEADVLEWLYANQPKAEEAEEEAA